MARLDFRNSIGIYVSAIDPMDSIGRLSNPPQSIVYTSGFILWLGSGNLSGLDCTSGFIFDQTQLDSSREYWTYVPKGRRKCLLIYSSNSKLFNTVFKKHIKFPLNTIVHHCCISRAVGPSPANVFHPRQSLSLLSWWSRGTLRANTSCFTNLSCLKRIVVDEFSHARIEARLIFIISSD